MEKMKRKLEMTASGLVQQCRVKLSVCYHLQFFGEAREHVGDTFVNGSCLLEQQQAFGSCSEVQQAVQQRLLPEEPGIKSVRKTQ